jgi:hypothetical protein
MGKTAQKMSKNVLFGGKRQNGRPKGVLNKNTKALKEMILGALDANGGEDYLAQQARENPNAFLTLLGKTLPADIKAELSGADGKPLSFAVTVNIVKPKP